jgi:hypothetical protein
MNDPTRGRCPVCLWRRPVAALGVCVRCRGQLRALSAARPNVVPRQAELRPGLDPEQRPEVREHAGRHLREMLLHWLTDQRIEDLVAQHQTWSSSDCAVVADDYRAAYARRAELFAMGYSLDAIRQIRQVLSDFDDLPSDDELHDMLDSPPPIDINDDLARFRAWWQTGARDDEDAATDDEDDDDDDDDESLRRKLSTSDIPGVPYSRIAELVEARFACSHPSSQLRLRRVSKSGSTGIRRQCLQCGEAFEIVNKALVPRAGEGLPRFDEDLAQRRQEAQQAYRQKLWALGTQLAQERQESADRNWWLEHDAYLRGPVWARKRRAVLERDRHRCQARIDGCTGEAEQVHHKTYQHWKQEPLWELISVCVHCHELLTAQDRARRAQRYSARP